MTAIGQDNQFCLFSLFFRYEIEFSLPNWNYKTKPKGSKSNQLHNGTRVNTHFTSATLTIVDKTDWLGSLTSFKRSVQSCFVLC